MEYLAERKKLPQTVHVTRWCPMCGSRMHFVLSEQPIVEDDSFAGLSTVCNGEKCGFVWPLEVTQSTEKRQVL